MFTATALVVIDTRKVQVLPNQAALGDVSVDATDLGTVPTEIALLKSRSISTSVINELKLTSDPEFVGDGVLDTYVKMIPFLRSDEKLSEAQIMERALTAFDSRRTVKRNGQTYVIEIDFRSTDPEKAARIANAIAHAYETQQLEAKYQTARRAGTWLQDRLNELHMQSFEAEQAVVNFKRANNIVQSGKGLLMNEQQVSEVNTQLILARAATAEAKARLDRIHEVMRQEVPDASVADALKSEVIIRLRNQYLEYAARERIYENRYGASHLAAVNLRTQMLELQHNINDEMKKIAESYKSDYEIALSREQSLKNSLANVVSKTQDTNQAEIRARELESKAQSYRTLYGNFLQRYTESVQQQSFPIAEFRFVDPATAPVRQSYPKPFLVLALSTAAGLFLSFFVGIVREASDRTFRTTAQIKEILGANTIATLPALKLPIPLTDKLAKAVAPTAPRTIVNTHDLLSYVVDYPLSHFAEGFRALKVVVDLNGVLELNKVIGVTSTSPSEGKSTVASNFAHLIAHAGERAILVDCDLRNPSLSRRLAPNANVGLLDVIAGKIELEDALWTDPATGLKFLPNGATSKLLHTNKILASETLKTFIRLLLELFDYVIVDLPPLAPVVDARSTTHFINSYVYVVEWGKTKRDIAEHLLAEAQEIHERLLGVIVNKADISAMSHYEGYTIRLKDRNLYSRYGYVE